jgi:glycerate kinase
MPSILIAPSAYKGTLCAQALAGAIEAGLSEALAAKKVEFLKRPMADGGDDSLSCLLALEGIERVSLKVENALGEPVLGSYLRQGKIAYVELAQVCGLAGLSAVPSSEQALLASTIGLGEVLRHAIENGADELVVFLGGSASTDGGAGLLHGLGLRFLDKQMAVIRPCGATLSQIAAIDKNSLEKLLKFLKGVKFTFACDVNNPLLGAQGAAVIYGPQKGATASDVDFLECGLEAFVKLLVAVFPGALLSAGEPGAGAAGGCAFPLMVIAKASLCSGFKLLSDLLNFPQLLKSASLVVLAEGRLDCQSLDGKANGEILLLAQKLGKPVYAIPATYCLEPCDAVLFAGIYPAAPAHKQAGRQEVEAAAFALGKDLRAFFEDA